MTLGKAAARQLPSQPFMHELPADMIAGGPGGARSLTETTAFVALWCYTAYTQGSLRDASYNLCPFSSGATTSPRVSTAVSTSPLYLIVLRCWKTERRPTSSIFLIRETRRR